MVSDFRKKARAQVKSFGSFARATPQKRMTPMDEEEKVIKREDGTTIVIIRGEKKRRRVRRKRTVIQKLKKRGINLEKNAVKSVQGFGAFGRVF